MKNSEKEKSKLKISLPLILFIAILINYIPLIIPNSMSKESFSVSNMHMLICFIIEMIILGIWFMVNFIKNKGINITKEVKINLILLIVSTIILFVTQVLNFINKDFLFMDVLNIGCIFINIFILYICVMNIKTEENNIYVFFKLFVVFTTVSCIVSFFIYYKEIYELLVNGKYSWAVTIKSFFANRNTYAFILYLGIIADMFLINNDKKIIYKLLIPFFLFSLYTTSSRTGIILGLILIGTIFFFSDKINWKKKVGLVILGIVLAVISIVYVYNFNQEVLDKINRTLIRGDELKKLSGRPDIWKIGIDLLKENPKNLILGVGRFKSIGLLVDVGEYSKNFSQFHNIYLDILTTGGIFELAYILFIYVNVIRKVLNSNLEKKYKNIYKSMFLTYAIYIAIESFGRFSIGSSDTICLIFFITIPLLHANSIKNNE